MTTYANIIENGAPIGIGTAPLPPWSCPTVSDNYAGDSDYLFYLDLSASEASDFYFNLKRGTSNGFLNYHIQNNYYTIPAQQGYTGGDYSQGILPTPTDYTLDSYPNMLYAFIPSTEWQYRFDKTEVTEQTFIFPTETLATPQELWSGMDRVMYMGTVWHPSTTTQADTHQSHNILQSDHGALSVVDGSWKDLGNGKYSPRLSLFSLGFRRVLPWRRTYIRIAYYPVTGYHPVSYNLNPPVYIADYGTSPSGYSSYFLQEDRYATDMMDAIGIRHNNNITPSGTLTIAWHSNHGASFERNIGIECSGGYSAEEVSPSCSMRLDLYPA